MKIRALGVLILLTFFNCVFGTDFIVTNTENAGPGSLTQAVEEANQTLGPHLITFDPSLKGDTIVLLDAIQFNVDSLTINGDVDGDDLPDIIIRERWGGNWYGFNINSSNNIIRNLVFQNFWYPINISGSNNRIYNCYIGTNINGEADATSGNNRAIRVTGQGSGNTWASPVEGERNIITNNGSSLEDITIFPGSQNDISVPQIIRYDTITNTLVGTGANAAVISIYSDYDNEGAFFLGSIPTGIRGTWSFDIDLDTIPEGLNLVAIQDVSGNSSAFSDPFCTSYSTGLEDLLDVCEDTVWFDVEIRSPFINQSLDWDIYVGQGEINEYNEQYLMENIAVGSNFIALEVSAGYCTYFDTVVIRRDVSVVFSGEDDAVNVDFVQLNANNFIDGVEPPIDFRWSVQSGNGLFDDETDGQTIVRNLEPGINRFIWTANPTNAQACPTQDTVTITYIPANIPIDAGEDQYLCGVNSFDGVVFMEASVPGSDWVGRWTVNSFPLAGDDPEFADPTLYNSRVNLWGGFGRYEFVWTITNLRSQTLIERDTVIIDYERTPNHWNDFAYSCGDTAKLVGNLPAGFNGTWSNVSGIYSVIEENDSIYRIGDLSHEETVYVRWEIERDYCQLSSVHEINFQNIPSFSLGNDYVINESYEDSIFFEQDGDYTYDWFFVAGFAEQDFNFPETFWYNFQAASDTNLVIIGGSKEFYGGREFRNSNKGLIHNQTCRAFDTITITILPDVEVSNDSLEVLGAFPDSIDVRLNDFVFDGGNLAPSILVNPANGIVELNTDGLIVYTSSIGFAGIDSLEYELCDSSNRCDEGYLYFEVLPFQLNEDTIASLLSSSTDTAMIHPLANDSLAEGFGIRIASVTLLTNSGAEVSLSNDSIQYIPKGFVGTDTLAYTVCTNDDRCVTDTILVIVPNTAPIGTPDRFNISQGDSLIMNLAVNDFDLDNQDLTISVLSDSQFGFFRSEGDSSIQYFAYPDTTGVDTLTYEVCDILQDCDTSFVVITVLPPNSVSFDEDSIQTCLSSVIVPITKIGVLIDSSIIVNSNAGASVVDAGDNLIITNLGFGTTQVIYEAFFAEPQIGMDSVATDTLVVLSGFEFDAGEPLFTCFDSVIWVPDTFNTQFNYSLVGLETNVRYSNPGDSLIIDTTDNFLVTVVNDFGCIAQDTLEVGVSPRFSLVDDFISFPHTEGFPLRVFDGRDTIFVADTLFAVDILEYDRSKAEDISVEDSLLRYTPLDNWSGNDTITYKVTNLCNQDTLLGVAIVNVTPVSRNDLINFRDERFASVTLASLAENDLGSLDQSTIRFISFSDSTETDLTSLGAEIILSSDQTEASFDYTDVDLPGTLTDSVLYEITDALNQRSYGILFMNIELEPLPDTTMNQTIVSEVVVTVNSISTNNDNTNNYLDFTFRGSDNRPFEIESISSVSIFTKWGDEVFFIENYDETQPSRRFEGRDERGELLSDGTYYYVIEFEVNDDVTITRKGKQTSSGFFLIRSGTSSN